MLACAIATTTETSTTNAVFLKPLILRLKPPLALQPHLDLVLSRTRFFFYKRSSFALLTTMTSEMRQWQSVLYHALTSAQFFAIIIWSSW